MSNAERRTLNKQLSARDFALRQFKAYGERIQTHEITDSLSYKQLVENKQTLNHYWNQYRSALEALGPNDDTQLDDLFQIEEDKNRIIAQIQIKLESSPFSPQNVNNSSTMQSSQSNPLCINVNNDTNNIRLPTYQLQPLMENSPNGNFLETCLQALWLKMPI